MSRHNPVRRSSVTTTERTVYENGEPFRVLTVIGPEPDAENLATIAWRSRYTSVMEKQPEVNGLAVYTVTRRE